MAEQELLTETQQRNSSNEVQSEKELKLIQELVSLRKESDRSLEYEQLDDYRMPPRTHFAMLKKPAVSIKYGRMTFNMAAIRLFEGTVNILPMIHEGKFRLAAVPCTEEENASVEWARKNKQGKWTKFVVEAQSAEGETDGYLRIENSRSAVMYIQKVQVGYYPDNHRPQTEQEMKDTIMYAINTWCDGLMKINAGRISLFDLIEEAIDTKTVMDNGMFDLKHSTDKIYWQDVLGSENYAPVVSKVASDKFAAHEGDPSLLKFFISETGLEDEQTFESLKYWINTWDANGAKIDGINAKVSLNYSEDAATLAANKAAYEKLLGNLASTGKMIRLSNFDIKYKDAEGTNVSASAITASQRQNLADFYAYAIRSYMNTIPNDKQAGICKANLSDTSDPVGLWAIDTKTKDWVRTATYKAFCEALSGQ